MLTRHQYVTDNGVIVYEAELVYDPRSMEPVIIGPPHKDGWFVSRKLGSNFDSRSKILNGKRIVSIEYAAEREWPGAKEALKKVR